MKALAALVASELRLFLREPVLVFFGVAFPALLVVALGKLIPGFDDPVEGSDLRIVDLYLPVTLALAIATVSMTLLLNLLSTYRERGILRRLATTPVAPAKLLGAQLVVNVLALIAGCGLAYLAAVVSFAVPAPASLGWVLLAFGLGALAMCAVVLVIAAVAPSARVSSGIGTIVYFPMMFFAGVWTPGPSMPESVRRIADFTPLGAASQAMQDAWFGASPQPLHLFVLAGYVVVLGAVAVRAFRW